MLCPRGFVPQHVGSVKQLSTVLGKLTPVSRKNRRSQSRKPQRGSAAGARPRGVAAPTPSSRVVPPGGPSQQGSAPAPPPPIERTYKERPRGRLQAGPLAAQEAAVPLERVPYFRSDLRRIGITAGAMFVILVIGSFLIR